MGQKQRKGGIMTQEEHLEYSHQASNSVCDQVNDDSTESKNTCIANQVNDAKSSAISEARKVDNSVAEVLDINDNILEESGRVVIESDKSELNGGELRGDNLDMTVITQQNSSDNIRDIQTKIENPEKNVENQNASVKDVSDSSETRASDLNLTPEGATCDSNVIPNSSDNVAENQIQNEAGDSTSMQLHNKLSDNLSEDHKKSGDPIARLDALRTNISNVLKEVKAVLSQHGEQTNEPEKEEAKPSEDNIIRFRFVKRIRKRSIIDLEEEEKQKSEDEEKPKAEETTQEQIAEPAKNQTKVEQSTQERFGETAENQQKETDSTGGVEVAKIELVAIQRVEQVGSIQKESGEINKHIEKTKENVKLQGRIGNEKSKNEKLTNRRSSIEGQKISTKEKAESKRKAETKAGITRKNSPKEKVSKPKANGDSTKRARRGSKDMTKANFKPQSEELSDANNVNDLNQSSGKPEILITEPQSNKKDLIPIPSLDLVPVPAKEIVPAPRKDIVIVDNALVSKSANKKEQAENSACTIGSMQKTSRRESEINANVLLQKHADFVKEGSKEKELENFSNSIGVETKKLKVDEANGKNGEKKNINTSTSNSVISLVVGTTENKTTQQEIPISGKESKTAPLSALEKVLAATNLKVTCDTLPVGKILSGKSNRSKSPSPECAPEERKSSSPAEIKDQLSQESQSLQKAVVNKTSKSKLETQPVVINEQKDVGKKTTKAENNNLKEPPKRGKSASITEGDKIKKIFKFVQAKTAPANNTEKTTKSDVRRHSMPASLLSNVVKTTESLIPNKKQKNAEEKKTDLKISAQESMKADKVSMSTRSKPEVAQNLQPVEQAKEQNDASQSHSLTASTSSPKTPEEKKPVPLKLPVIIEPSKITTVALKPQLAILPSPTKAVQSTPVKVEVEPIETTFTETASKPPQVPLKENLEQESTETATANKEEEKDKSEEGNKSEVENKVNEEKVAPPRKRKMKKKVVIRRIKRKLSLESAATPENVPEQLEPEICEKEIEPEPKAPEEEKEEKVPPKPKSCLKVREYQPGDVVMYADRIKKAVKWKKGTIVEKVTSISYKLNVDGEEKSAHVCYIKKYTSKKVQFGGKEYLEIDYAQEESEDEEEKRPFSIWDLS